MHPSRECFIYRLRQGCEAEYEELHSRVWPEVIQQLRASGYVEYTIYRRGDLVISITRRAADHDAEGEVSPRVDEWQALMAPLFRETVDADGELLYARQIFDIGEEQYSLL